jgi:uncharacterized membrane protein (GlpM family)
MKMKMKMTTGVKVALGAGAVVIIYLLWKKSQDSTALPGGVPAQPAFLPINILPVNTVQPISNAGISDPPALTPLTLTFN